MNGINILKESRRREFLVKRCKKILAVSVALAMVLTLLPLMGTTVMANAFEEIDIDTLTSRVVLEPNTDYRFFSGTNSTLDFSSWSGPTQHLRQLIFADASSAGFNGTITLYNITVHGAGTQSQSYIHFDAGANDMTVNLVIIDSTLSMQSGNGGDIAIVHVREGVERLNLNVTLEDSRLRGIPVGTAFNAQNGAGGIHIGGISTNSNPASTYLGSPMDTMLDITLIGNNEIIAGNGSTGINVPAGSTLTIDGPGSLTVRGLVGIGANRGGSGGIGDITFNGGTVHAGSNGNPAGPAIGFGGNLTPATGDANINAPWLLRAEGSITINDGATVTAIGSLEANGGGAGIGSGVSFPSPRITINGGTVVATTGAAGGGAPIGTGINVGRFTNASADRSGIMGDITINGGHVTATALHNFASAIGTATPEHRVATDAITDFTTGNIFLLGGTVIAEGGTGNAANHYRAVIGGNHAVTATPAPAVRRRAAVQSLVISPNVNLTMTSHFANMPHIAHVENVFYLNEFPAIMGHMNNAAQPLPTPHPMETVPENFTIAVDEGTADVTANFSPFGPFAALNSVLFRDVTETPRELRFFSNIAATGNVTFSADEFDDEIVDAEDLLAATAENPVVVELGEGDGGDPTPEVFTREGNDLAAYIEVPYDADWDYVLAALPTVIIFTYTGENDNDIDVYYNVTWTPAAITAGATVTVTGTLERTTDPSSLQTFPLAATTITIDVEVDAAPAPDPTVAQARFIGGENAFATQIVAGYRRVMFTPIDPTNATPVIAGAARQHWAWSVEIGAFDGLVAGIPTNIVDDADLLEWLNNNMDWNEGTPVAVITRYGDMADNNFASRGAQSRNILAAMVNGATATPVQWLQADVTGNNFADGGTANLNAFQAMMQAAFPPAPIVTEQSF